MFYLQYAHKKTIYFTETLLLNNFVYHFKDFSRPLKMLSLGTNSLQENETESIDQSKKPINKI